MRRQAYFFLVPKPRLGNEEKDSVGQTFLSDLYHEQAEMPVLPLGLQSASTQQPVFDIIYNIEQFLRQRFMNKSIEFRFSNINQL